MQVIDQSQLAARIQFLYKETPKVRPRVQFHQERIKTLFCFDGNVSVLTHLGNGVDGVPALSQDLWVGVIEEADEA